MSTFTMTMHGITVTGDNQKDVMHQAGLIHEMVTLGLMKPVVPTATPATALATVPAPVSMPDQMAATEGVWNKMCLVADSLYTTSTKDAVDNMCETYSDMYNGAIDWLISTRK